MRLHRFHRPVLTRWRTAWTDAVTSSLAAGSAWYLSQAIFGHRQPVFAAVAAAVCLAPGLPNRVRQAMNMLLGLVTGILVGEALLRVPLGDAAIQIVVMTFLASMLALSFGLAPVIVIQASVSAVLVLALGPVAAGPVRLLDALTGTGVALVFSQVLFTPHPLRRIERSRARLMERLAQTLDRLADAVTNSDAGKAQAALDGAFATRAELDALVASIQAARVNARTSVRGWLLRNEIRSTAARYERPAMRLYGSIVFVAEAVVSGLANGEPRPDGLADQIRMISVRCLAPGAARTESASTITSGLDDTADGCDAPSWRACLEHLRAADRALDEIKGGG